MAKPISHIVTRPGRVAGEPDVEIPVAEDLATTPGIPLREVDVSFYSRVDPLESQNVEKGADRDWVWSVYAPDVADYIRGHDERMKPYVDEALASASVEPSGVPQEGEDLTDDIRRAARELGFGEIGFTSSTAATSTRASVAGSSSPTRSASRWSRTTTRPRASPASKPSTPTTAHTSSRARRPESSPS